MATTPTINGEQKSFDVRADTPLLWVLRDVLGMTGTKFDPARCPWSCLTRLQQPTNLRRFDVADDGDIVDTALPLARAADTFVALRPNGQSNEPEGLIESLLCGTGRHLFLAPENWNPLAPLDNVVVAWNDSRESARALAEALPYLHQARKVGVLVLEGEHSTEADALKGNEAVHPGITASMR
jgi:hypothetical protein